MSANLTGPTKIHARVAELADAPDSESGGLNTRGGANPLSRTKKIAGQKAGPQVVS